jgi:hypothetical protein
MTKSKRTSQREKLSKLRALTASPNVHEAALAKEKARQLESKMPKAPALPALLGGPGGIVKKALAAEEALKEQVWAVFSAGFKKQGLRLRAHPRIGVKTKKFAVAENSEGKHYSDALEITVTILVT